MWQDGAHVDPGQASWKLTDRGALLGDGVFETLRAVRGRPIALAAHLARFERGAGVLGITLPEPIARVEALARELAAKLAVPDAVVRITLHRGPGPRGLARDGYETPSLVITARAHQALPPEAYARGVTVQTVSKRRIPPECLDPTIKHANALPAILGRRELPADVHEGIMRSISGQIACGLASNIFAVVRGTIVTPPLTTGCLAGITRARVLALADEHGLDPEEAPLLPEDLARASEAFLTSSLVGVLPIARVDGVALERCPGPNTAELARALAAAVEAEVADA